MEKKVILITGANSGIGYETTRAIAGQGALIIMACRNLQKAVPICQGIRQEKGNPDIEVMRLDLASFHSLREFAAGFSAKYGQINVLINNGGTFCLKRELTEDGFEKTIGTNYLGPYLLTRLLLPLLLQTPASRIVNVGSAAHFSGQLDLNNLNKNRGFFGFPAYASSKLALVFFTQELAARLHGKNVTANSIHPGHVTTNIWNLWPDQKWFQHMVSRILKPVMTSVLEASRAVVHLATSDAVEGVSGCYFDGMKPVNPSRKCRDLQVQKALWELSEQITGLNDQPVV